MQRDLLAALLCLLATAACSNGGGNAENAQLSGNRDATANKPPVISGSPATSATVGESYSFTPSARDPEGRALSFSILRKPSWATFSAKTGRLYGTPAAGDMGSHIDIVISVTDGHTKISLPAFAITVSGKGNGSATLSWYPPTQNADGSYLSDLAGYRIYFGRSADTLNSTIVLTNPGLSRYMVEGLPSARWYFAMTAYDHNGNESRRSPTVNKSVG